MYENLSDKRAYSNTLGCLMLDTTLIDDIDRPLDRTDFNTEAFYELIYVAIYNLYMNGCQTIDEFTKQTDSLRGVKMEAASIDANSAADAGDTKKQEFEQMKAEYVEKLRLQMQQADIQQRNIRARRLRG